MDMDRGKRVILPKNVINTTATTIFSQSKNETKQRRKSKNRGRRREGRGKRLSSCWRGKGGIFRVIIGARDGFDFRDEECD
ncbi:hypothetical protein Sjap_014549 [Stephania japonica]|uniref:Uncharacterized protein n=1 Tax=Stephania japonica TaxID=461633 RepID=A0AAP0IHS2_9MAGN